MSTGHTVAQQGATGALHIEDAAMSRIQMLLGLVRTGCDVERKYAASELISTLVAATTATPLVIVVQVAAG